MCCLILFFHFDFKKYLLAIDVYSSFISIVCKYPSFFNPSDKHNAELFQYMCLSPIYLMVESYYLKKIEIFLVDDPIAF